MKDSTNLDALRTLAVGLVLLSHVPFFLDRPAWSFDYVIMGHAGVALFFVHTTLVLMMSMQRNGPAFGPFMLRRVFRIYPLSILTVILMAVLLWFADTPLGLSELVSNLLLVQNITGHRPWPAPLWTLPYEVQMYLFLPALFVLTSVRPILRAVALYAAALGVVSLAWTNGAQSWLVGFIPCFLPGILAFALMGRVPAKLHPAALFVVAGAGALVIPALAEQGPQALPFFWVLCLATGLLIPFSREIRWKPLVTFTQGVAKYSYCIYLTHIPIMGLAFTGGPLVLQAALYLLLQWAVAALVWRLVEQPGIRLGAKLAAKLQVGVGRRSVAPAGA